MVYKNSKERILKKIKNNLLNLSKKHIEPSAQPEVIKTNADNIDVFFAENLKASGTEFVYCENKHHFSKQLRGLVQQKKWNDIWVTDKKILSLLDELNLQFPCSNNLKHSDAAMTSCEALIADTGSIAVSSQQKDGRISSAYSPVHICVGYSHQVVNNLSVFLHLLKHKYAKKQLASVYSLITGPSKTADIEKTLVKGIHGPNQVYLFFIDT